MADDAGEAPARLLGTLERLFEVPALELRDALMHAAQLVAEALECEKVDAFLLDEERQSLVAIGTSATPLGNLQRRLGLDVLPLANGGNVVEVFRTGSALVTGRADLETKELPGILHDLGVRSEINVPLYVNDVRRGVLAAVSPTPEFFGPSEVRFMQVVARWVGLLTHRAELVQELRSTEAERARRMAADEIVTVLAHDLRNHLNPLLGRLHLVRLALTGVRPVDVTDIDAALRSVERLSRLTSDLLDSGRIEQGLFALKLAPVGLVELVKQTCSSLETATVTTEVSAPSELIIVADSGRLAQALENLVANAVQHSPLGGVVRVSVSAPDDGRVARVQVADEGSGIPHELLPRVFERFVQGRRSRGLGLGLYLARSIAEAHGGTLEARSAPGRGTQFTLELPIDADPNRVRPQPKRTL